MWLDGNTVPTLDYISRKGVTTIEQYDQLKKEYQEFLKDHNLVEYN